MCDAGVSLLGEIRCQSLMGVKGKRVSFSGNPSGITSEFRFSLEVFIVLSSLKAPYHWPFIVYSFAHRLT